ncbi:MAG: 6,7-dimethyl-8-ribityllumazine synthase [Verrucomicrobiota bacterium]|jgi:6,7-dimethyl-8-ribityllumazine synthase
MSNIVPPRPRSSAQRRHFTFVASKFNAEYVQGLVDHAKEELRAISHHFDMSIHEVPGAFEIPVVVRELAMQKNSDAILAFAVILKGHTAHAENLSRSVTDALQRIAIENGVPIINAVLSLEDEEQARERCLENTINRGTEAARAAWEMANVMSQLRAK